PRDDLSDAPAAPGMTSVMPLPDISFASHFTSLHMNNILHTRPFPCGEIRHANPINPIFEKFKSMQNDESI
ncbi:MAG TPA: hypothetical protein PKJ58_04375, partial [Prolixibacteraceae bacterium]|nr:hypothetical protein [Prolixibacteraceae bacterium]